MTAAVWASRCVLAAVLLFAAQGKARDQPGTRRAAAALGMPDRTVAATALVLPAGEALAAALLLVPATARIGAVVAGALLASFSIVIARTLRAGRRPPCHCFGAAPGQAIGYDSLVRNAALLVLAVVAGTQ